MEKGKKHFIIKTISALIVAFAMTLALAFGIVPETTLTAHAATSVSYLDENGATQSISNYTEVSSSTNNGYNEWDSGWYVVTGEKNINDLVQILGALLF